MRRQTASFLVGLLFPIPAAGFAFELPAGLQVPSLEWTPVVEPCEPTFANGEPVDQEPPPLVRSDRIDVPNERVIMTVEQENPRDAMRSRIQEMRARRAERRAQKH